MSTPEPNTVAAYVHNDAHVAQGLAQLSAQFQGKPKIAALLSAFLTQVQLLEDETWKLIAQGGPAAALTAGWSTLLDQIGTLVGITRQGLSDAAFYWAIQGAIAANRSQGSCADVIGVTITAGAGTVIVTESFPAAMLVDPAMPLFNYSSAVLIALLRRTKSAGVRLNLLDYPAGDIFSCSDTEFVETSATLGFSDTTGVAGGNLMGVVE